MTFDITGYLKEISLRVDVYMGETLNGITINNPEWIERLKKDKDLINPDGTPRTDLTPEIVNAKILEVLKSADFKQYEVKKEDIYKLFIVTKEDVDKFIMI